MTEVLKRALLWGVWGMLHLLLPVTLFGQPSLAQHLPFPEGTIYSILRDKKGFMWFGASSGLYRYDGYTTVAYRHDPGNANSLSDSFVMKLCEDDDGNLWIGTLNGGLNKFIPATQTFIRLNKSTPDSLGISEKLISDIDKDKAGNIWVVANGLYKINPATLKTERYAQRDNKFSLTGIFFDKHGNSWIYSNGDGIGRFDTATRNIEAYTLFHPEPVTRERANVIRSIREDKDGNLWLATYGGLARFDPTTKTFTHWVNEPGNSRSLRHNSLWEIYPDRDGKIWIASWGGGISYFDPNTGQFENNAFKPGGIFGITSNEVRCLYVDADGTRWCGTNGNGIYKIKTRAGLNPLPGSDVIKRPVRNAIEGERYLYFLSDQHGLIAYTENEGLAFTLPPFRDRKPNGLGGNFVSGVAERGDGKIFIGTDFGVTEHDPVAKKCAYYVNIPGDGTTLSHNSVNTVFIDSKNKLWVGTPFDVNLFIPDTKQFYKFRNPEFYNNSVLQLLETKEGLWIGTARGGLTLLDPDTGKSIQSFQYSTENNSGLTNNFITALFEDSKNYVWIGTQQGLNRYDPVKKIVERIPPQSGLTASLVKDIVENSSQEILVYNDAGIFSFRPSDDIAAIRFKKIPSPLVNSTVPAIKVKGKNFFLLFAENQVYRLPVTPTADSVPVSPMVITQFALDPNNRHPLDSAELRVDPAYRKHITLDYDQNLFSIEFALLDFTDSENNQYAYILENFDETWTYSGTRRFVTYTNISPGTYTFRAKGAGHSGAWNEEGVSLTITILPPPWKTWWAYTLYAIGFIALLLAARQNIINRERLKTRIALEQKEKQTLKELDHLKTKFFSNITHEFRTPLTLIQGPADHLLEKTSDPESIRQLQLIKDNAQRLLKLINQLLDLAKLDANEMNLYLQPLDLAALVRNTLTQFTSLAESKNISYLWQLTEPLPPVLGDAEKIETIIINLVSNAMKFTPHGKQVRVSTQFQDYTFTLKVEDTGRGIPANKLPHIFERFYQVEASDSSHAEGTGIGLALVKEYVELMKGIIHVESQPGKGTAFTIILHFTPSTQPVLDNDVPATNRARDEHAQESDAPAHLPLILLVEDNEDIRTLIKTCLGSSYRYSEARHGKEGLEKARAEVPDIIISDLMMPEMDGLEFCARVKKDNHTNHIPFIMLTAKASDEHKISGLQTGADDYLIKPFRKEELIFKVQNLIHLREKLQEHIKLNLLTSPSPVEATSAAEQFILKARTFVEAHLGDSHLSVETLAAELNLSREQCYRKFMALTGLPPSAFIRKLRLQRAARLLAAQAGPVSQVAYEVGYENLSHFSKAFKEEFGKLPSEYTG
jgi:signal transduction histidine kinase/ligand-binding sensor domain-containing protein/DNA-binding response OmpR family regulator